MSKSSNQKFSPYGRLSRALPIIVFAPQGCGMSSRRHEIAGHLNRRHIVEEWDGSTNVPEDSVLLTNDFAFENIQRWRGRADLPALSVVRFSEIARHLRPTVFEIARPVSAASTDASSDVSNLSR